MPAHQLLVHDWCGGSWQSMVRAHYNRFICATFLAAQKGGWTFLAAQKGGWLTRETIHKTRMSIVYGETRLCRHLRGSSLTKVS